MEICLYGHLAYIYTNKPLCSSVYISVKDFHFHISYLSFFS